MTRERSGTAAPLVPPCLSPLTSRLPRWPKRPKRLKRPKTSRPQKKIVLSEDANAGYATPIMDMIAAGIVAAIALVMAIVSLRLPVPGGIFTAPGLLPFLTSASLLIMAGVLGFNALGRRRTTPRELDRIEVPSDFKRSLALGGIVIIYVLGLQFVPVRTSFNIGSLHFVIGAFETVSVVVITGLLRFYWRAPLWACLTVDGLLDRLPLHHLPHRFPNPLAVRPPWSTHCCTLSLPPCCWSRSAASASASSGAPCRGSPPPWR